MQHDFNLLRSRIAPILGFFLIIICLLPILRSGLYSDDLPNFQIGNSYHDNSCQQIFARAGQKVENWKREGRYTPLSLYLQEIVFSESTTLIGYKTYVVCCNVLAVLAFVFMLGGLGRKNLIGLFLLFYAGEIQFRIQLHDAFTSLHGMYPLLCFFAFSCVGFYGLYLSKSKWYFYAISLVLSAIPILISESGVFVLPALFVCGLYLAPGFKKAVKQLIPFVAVYGVYILYIASLRHTASIHYPGLEVDFSLDKMLSVIEIQLFSAVPFSNLCKQAAIPHILLLQMDNVYSIVSVAILVVVGTFISFGLLWSKDENGISKPTMLVNICLILLFVPALTLAPSVKYQNELWGGAGYLPVYIQNFGFALLLAVFTGILLRYQKAWGRILVTLFFTANLLGTISGFLFNAALIKVRNYDFSIPGTAMGKSIQNGILDKCPQDSRIILNNAYYFYPFYADIFENRLGKEFHVYMADKWLPDSSASNSMNCYLLECVKADTVFTRLYRINCPNGVREMLIRCDTTLHTTRVTEAEEVITVRKD